MGRRLRLHLPGGFYHTTLRGNHRENIFTFESDRLLLNSIVRYALEKHGARIHAYCWMTNHLHMLVQVGEDPLAGFMRRIASGYARAYQSKRQTTGHLFEKRYHSVLVDADNYLLTLLRYIHLNPVRAKLVSVADDYRWSSHHAYSGDPVDDWVTTNFGWKLFSRERCGAIRAYRNFVACDAAEIPSPFADIDEDRPDILGDDAFFERVRQQVKLPPSRQTLDSLIADGCQRFGLAFHELASELRNERIVAARGWIAKRAIERRIATVSEVARVVGCTTKTIRRALQLPNEEPKDLLS